MCLAGFEAKSIVLRDPMANPIGTITMWSGLLADIPVGWQLCDGTNGTPDLRYRFILPTAPGAEPGVTGGSWSHTHDFTGDGHVHTINAQVNVASAFDVVCWDTMTDGQSVNSGAASGTTDGGSSSPPSYTLALIMRMF